LPGILNWLIAGAKDWAASGLGETPLAVSSALVDYQSAEDWLGAFIRDCTRPHGDAIVRKRAVYERYRAWADENGYRHPLTSHALTKTLKGRGWHDGGGTDYWRGWTVAEGNADEGLHN
jgi:phage/plasmid-associated DNA primase